MFLHWSRVNHWRKVNRWAVVAAVLGGAVVLLLGIGGGYLVCYRHGGADATKAVTDLRAGVAEDALAR